MNILLTGASGFVGSHILRALIEQGHQITACIHHSQPQKHPRVCLFQSDYSQINSLSDWLPALTNIDLVINTVGLIYPTKQLSFEQIHYKAVKHLFDACLQVKVKQIIQISALGAAQQAITDYQQTKYKADEYLKQQCPSAYILRPSLIYGSGGKSFQWFQYLSNQAFIGLIDQGQQIIQPIHISDLVATIIQCIKQPTSSPCTLNLVGKDALSYKQWLLALRQKTSPPIFIKLPYKLMLILSQYQPFLPKEMLNPDNLKMLQQNNQADSQPLTKFLNHPPLSLKEGLEYDLLSD